MTRQITAPAYLLLDGTFYVTFHGRLDGLLD
jgi:hypothetical protein